jgi:monovalent cation/hydrogen antiporter
MTTPARSPSLRGVGQMIGNEIRRVAFQRSPAHRGCAHLTDTRAAPEAPAACPGCVRDSTSWVQLRMCLACGSVGCCDSSAGRHAVGHYAATGHPVMRSIEPGATWGWCYVDEAYVTLDAG